VFLFLNVWFPIVCKRVFLADFVQSKENVEKKKELDERAKEAEKQSNPRGGGTVLGRLKHMKEESTLQYDHDGDDRMIEMTENPMVSSSAAYRIEEGRARGFTDGGGITGSLGGSPSFHQSRKTISFRQSEAMIDSDDETEGISVQETGEEEGTGQMVMPTITHPLGSRRKKKVSVSSTSNTIENSSNNEDDFEMVVNAVFSLAYVNPDIHLLFNEGKYLTSSILSLPSSSSAFSPSSASFYTSSGVSSSVADMSTSCDLMQTAGGSFYSSFSEETKRSSTPLSVSDDYFNWVENAPFFQYLLVKTILPLSSVFPTSSPSSFMTLIKKSLSFLENKLLLVVSHWIVGVSSHCYHHHNRGEQFQTRKLLSSFLYPTWKSMLFGGRLLAVHSLSKWKGNSHPTPSSSSFSTTNVKYCTSLSSIYSLFSAAACISSLSPTSVLSFSTLTSCISTDLPIKLLSSTAECYLLLQNQHDSLSTPVTSSSDYIPSFLGVGYFGTKIFSSFSLSSPSFSFLSTLRTMVFVDYVSRLVISLLPTFKATRDMEGLFDIVTYNIQQLQSMKEGFLNIEKLNDTSHEDMQHDGIHCLEL
jgi:hypothetical protein